MTDNDFYGLPPVANTEVETRDYNLPIYGQRGEFSISQGVTVPYFTALMDLERVTSQLKTHEQVNPSLDTVYNLVELFQRKIDIERVERDIVEGYLKVPNKLKFFNCLTIVLLPKDVDGHICQSFESYPNNDPVIPHQANDKFDTFFSEPKWSKSIFGGVQFVATSSASLARLRWDRSRVDAVAVDGQHRLKALKLWMDGKNNTLSDSEKPTRIPIIFLLLHESAGFKISSDFKSSGIKSIAREIFTDLNKNAREVDLATQIILDDRSVESICVRSLVTETTCTDHEDLLPLSLLRWNEANYRFDQRYFLNSLVNLHLIVKDLIGLDPPKDPMNKSNVLNFINQANERLGTGIPRTISSNGVDLKEYYQDKFFLGEEDPIAPFVAIPNQFLTAAVKGFGVHYSTWLLKLLTRPKPYSQIIEYARVHNLIEGEFSQFLSQPTEHQKQLGNDLECKYGNDWYKQVIAQHDRRIESIKGLRDDPKGEQWAYKTIFQKALVRLGRLLFVEIPEDQSERTGTIDDFILFIDCLYSNDVLRILAPLEGHSYKLWTFIAVNFGNNKIKVSTNSEKRIQNVLTLWYFGWRYSVAEGKQVSLDQEKEGYLTTKQILKFFSTKASQALWPTVNDSYNEIKNMFMKDARIIDGKTDDVDIDDKEKSSISSKRLLALFTHGLQYPVDGSAVNLAEIQI